MQWNETVDLKEVTSILSLKERRLNGRSNEAFNDSALIVGN